MDLTAHPPRARLSISRPFGGVEHSNPTVESEKEGARRGDTRAHASQHARTLDQIVYEFSWDSRRRWCELISVSVILE